MPTILSKLAKLRPTTVRDAAPAIIGTSAAFLIVHLYKKHYKLGKNSSKSFVIKSDEKKDKSQRAQVDLNFAKKLLRILRIIIPSVFSAEALFMVLIAGTLLMRTFADLWMIKTSTKIEAAIIARKRGKFMQSTMLYLMCMPLISVVNSFLKFGLSELKLRFRERLTNHLYKQYLNGFIFYKMSNLDNRIANADQLLTQDVDRFCEGIVELYSNLSKPLVDVTLYVTQIGGSLGFQAPGRLFIYLVMSGVVLTYLRQSIGKMTVVEQQLEGEYRFVNSRLIVNSEEIAFYQGHEREKASVMDCFRRMIAHLRSLILFRFSIGFVENIVAKYCATVVGWYTMSRPFFSTTNTEMMNKSKTKLMENYYSSGRMMFKLAEALGRLALAGREMTRLAGFTARVDELVNVLNDLEKGHYQRTMITAETLANGASTSSLIRFAAAEGKNSDFTTANKGDLDALNGVEESSKTMMTAAVRRPGAGRVVVCDNLIRFDQVPLVTPNGDVLIESLNLEVKSGANVLICGPNGCGKSSLFRVLGELWPLWGGVLTKPAKGKLFYVPQRPYMTLGTLRDQVIYPDKPEDMRRRGVTDVDLADLLEYVQLSNILTREGGWDSQQDWMDVLSGGEKQRVAMARLFYHRPQFAILDECTSAVSADVEDAIYRRCHSLEITLFTVSHRKSLWKHHDYFLQMDGRGSYKFDRITENIEHFGS